MGVHRQPGQPERHTLLSHPGCVGRGEWIGALIDDLDTALQKYEFAAAVRYGVPLYGHDLNRRWKEKATSFPDRLAVKLVQQNLWLGPWFNRATYAERGDHLVLAQDLVWMQQGIVNVLAALTPASTCRPWSTSGCTGCSKGCRSSRTTV